MSLKCPECSQSLEQDFGVMTCSGCGNVLFISMDGEVQLAKNEASPAEEFPVPIEISPVEYPSFSQEAITEPAEEPEPEPEPGLYLDSDSAEIVEDVSISPESFAAAIEVSDSAENEADSMDLADFSEIAIAPEAEPFDTTSNFKDVSKFNNSDQDSGLLQYSVMIENIDTKEIRLQLQQVLADPKFQWDPRALMKEIKMGKLKIADINPVKASVLIEQLQELPVQVTWTQHAYS